MMATRPTSPAEPTKKHPLPVRPNAHPYAIKTTSSALLSRSNSSPHTAHHTRHHYVPSSPSRIPTGTRVRHRHSSSLSSVEGEWRDGVRTVPAPLPTPPTFAASPDSPSVSLKPTDESKLTHRACGGEAPMPVSSATGPIIEQHNHDQNHKLSHDQDSSPEPYASLPHNPRRWNTDQLTTYLETSFKSGNNAVGDEDDSSLAEILECVRRCGFTGRELLRLTDADLTDTPLSEVQRAQLIERSRTLRAHVLRERIYVDSYHSHEVSDNSNDIYSQSFHTSTPFHSIRGASVSAEDLRLLPDDNTSEGEDAFPPSPAMSLHRSNSLSDATVQRYRDLACMRMRRRGRVKGLVETWERASTSGSEYSASEGEGTMSGSEVESESETSPGFKPISDANPSPESPSDLPSVPHDEQTRDASSETHSPDVLQALPLSTPPPPYTHMYTSLGAVKDEEEEPTIEELLASSSSTPLRGARAWEADFGLGETVKRIPASASADAGSAFALVADQDMSRPKAESQQTRGDSVRSKRSSMRGSTGSRRKNAKTRKRVVTAIFTGPPSDSVSSAGDETNSVNHYRHASCVANDDAPATSDLRNDSDGAIRALEESIAATRAQMDVFRLRLEQVEADTARLEAESERGQPPDSLYSEFELRQRRSEPNEQVMAETAALPRGETLVEGLRDRDVLEGWETMSLGDIARAVVAKAMGWLFSYGRLGSSTGENQDRSQARTRSGPGVKERYPSPAKRRGRLPIARMSCSIILVSFAICAAVLRRMGFGRWVRRP